MIQAYDPRPHKWIALTMDNKFICAHNKLGICYDEAYELYGDDFYTVFGVEEEYRKWPGDRKEKE